MRIGLYYQDHLGSGGYPKDTRSLAEHLVRSGAEVFVYTFGDPDIETVRSTLRTQCEKGITVRLAQRKELDSKRYTLRRLEQWWSGNPDGIELMTFWGTYLISNIRAAMVARKNKIPYVVSPLTGTLDQHRLRGGIFRFLRKEAFLRLYFRTVLQHALTIHALSPFESEAIAKSFGIMPDKFIVVPLGIHTDEIVPTEYRRAPSRSSDPGSYFLYLGRPDIHQKSIDLLLGAAGQLASFLREKRLKLILAGKDRNNTWDKVSKIVAQKGLRDVVLVIRDVSDSEKYWLMERAVAFCHPSRYDGVPRSVRETLAVGTPVVVTRETNLSELVGHYDAGVVADLNATSIAKAMVKVSDPDLSQELRRNALHLASNELQWPALGDKYRTYYAKLLRGAML